MWQNLYDNRCCFPTLSCLCNLVQLKHELWNRYGFFFDVDVIAEIFPENELASWVMRAYENYSIAKIEFCDEEMVCERTNWSFDDRCLRRMRNFEEELQVGSSCEVAAIQRLWKAWRGDVSPVYRTTDLGR